MAARRKTGRTAIPKLPPEHRRKALALGRANAEEAIRRHGRLLRELRRHRSKLGLEAMPGPPPLLIAEGDSWFDYPFCDVLAVLKHTYGYDIESVAHRGDTVESMAYDPNQLGGVIELYGDLGTRKPAAILLSAGGNDIAGSAIETLLNYHGSARPGFSEAVMTGVFDERLHAAMLTEIGAISKIHMAHFGNEPPQILIHGYDYAVPDGRGYMGGLGPLPGPWLRPQFRARGYDVLAETTELMQQLIDRFNAMAKAVASAPEVEAHVTYVDLRKTLSNDLAGNRYRKAWANELHPTQDGFKLVAAKFDAALEGLA